MSFSPFWMQVWLPPVYHPVQPCPSVYLLPVTDSCSDSQQRPTTPSSSSPQPLKPTSRRRTWTPEQDQHLLRVISELQSNYGTLKVPYRIIAKRFGGRTSKQIRQRYINKLDPTINTQPFTPSQDARICEFYLKQGPQWKILSEDLAGRTATMIKNRFNTKLKSILHEIRREKARQAGKGYQGAEIAKVQ